MIEGIKKARKSIFVKLFLVMLLTGILLNALVGRGYRAVFKDTWMPIVKNHAVRYLNHVIDEMGNPPKLEKAQALADQQRRWH